MTPEQEVQHASKVRAFLADDAVSGALGRLERRYYEEFIGATDSERRVRAWAKASVLRNFTDELQSVIDAGELRVLQAAKTVTPE